MSENFCSAIHQSVTTFVETPRGRELAQRGRRGELQPGEFFTAACVDAKVPVLDHLAQSFEMLPDNLEQAYLQAWALAEQSARGFDLDWRLDDTRIAAGVEVRYRLELEADCVRFVVDAIAETSITA